MKARYFIIIGMVAAVVAVVQVAAHQGHVRSLTNVIAAEDQSGQDTVGSLAEMKDYTSKHMMTGTNVYLASSYDRAVAAAKAGGQGQGSGAVYAQAQAACATKADSIVQSRCVSAYVASHAQPAANPQVVQLPSQSTYTHSFRSPSWTPDGTGVAMLVSAVALVFGIFLAFI